MDLFDREKDGTAGGEPLAARMRPRTLDEFIGQEGILGPGKLLRRAIEADRISSVLLWGPPGTGKTTLAHVIALRTRSQFLSINAVLAGVKDIRAAIDSAREARARDGRRTILFVDEVHRFNKAQQDALLPHVENGTIILIGATTENPYFEVIKPLVSRSRIFRLEPLTHEHLETVARRALADPERGYGGRRIEIHDDALRHLVDVAQGDARSLLNALELAVETTPPDARGAVVIDRGVAEESIQRRAILYDKDGDAHYDTISAFIKSLRGSDPDAALYWMAKMLHAGEDPRFVARRMVIFASEDIGLADPRAISVAVAAAHAVEYVGMPECQFNLSQACLYLATAPKSNSTMAYFDALKKIEETGIDEVPDPLKDASRDREGLGHGVGYKYPHAYREHWVAQQYLPGRLQGLRFYEPSDQGDEAAVAERVARLRARQAEGLSLEREIEDSERRRRGFRGFLAQEERIHGAARIRSRDRILDAAKIRTRDAVLDLGSPPGLLAWAILDRAPLGRVAVASAGGAALRALAAIVRERALDRIVRIVRADPRGLPFGGDSFDAAAGRGVLAPIEDRIRAAREILRILRPGGRIAVEEPVARLSDRLSDAIDIEALGGIGREIRAAEDDAFAEGPALVAFDDEALAETLRETGFEEVEVRRIAETFSVRVAGETIARWLEPSRGPVPSYADLVRDRLSPEAWRALCEAIERSLLGRRIERKRVAALITGLRA
ncbi:MAG: AAA family ATPase [Planctomycetes bacterium]|nr:AAA family ATPase [Planctomycetota bacterium]